MALRGGAKRGAAMVSIAAALQLVAAPLAAREPVELKRTDKWHLDYDEDTCTLVGDFDFANGGVVLRLTRSKPSKSFDLAVIGKPVTSVGTRAPFRVRFGVNGVAEDRLGILGTVGKIPIANLGQNALWTIPDKGKAAKGSIVVTTGDDALITQVELSPLKGRTYRLLTGPMDKPMKAFDTCIEDLIQHWGYDPAVMSRLQAPPTALTPTSTWLNSKDYPIKMAYGGESGIIEFRLDVDEAGKVVGCHTRQVSRSPEFADVTCKLLTTRAKLAPARDASGKPVKAFFVSSVYWLMAP